MMVQELERFGVEVLNSTSADFVATVEYDNLKIGMGTTIGNAIRRVILSQTSGFAIKSVAISGVQHEFSAIPGVKEDAQLLIMNLRKVVFKSEHQKILVNLSVSGPATITAANLDVTNGEVVNKEQYIGYIDKGFNLKAQLDVRKGCGVLLAKGQRDFEVEVGAIACDMFFSPIKSVNFEIIPSANSEYEKLLIRIETNGSVNPLEAFRNAVKILEEQLTRHSLTENEVISNVSQRGVEVLSPNLYLFIDDLPGMTTRMLKCLKLLGVVYVGDLVKLTRANLMSEPNFGENSLKKISEILESKGLNLGMSVPGWPPEGLEAKAEKMRHKTNL